MKRYLRLCSAVLLTLMVSTLFLSVPASAETPEVYYDVYYETYYTGGWTYYDGSWYYLTPDGEKATGWLFVDNHWYYLNRNGTPATGWLTYNGNRYYLDYDGKMVTGWLLLNTTWYYFDADGAMQTGWVFSGNYWYFLNRDGTMDPNIQESADWMLVLVNRWNPIPENYTPRLKTLPSGYQVDERIVNSLNSMLSDARANGLSPVITSAYRTVARQQVLYSNKVSQLQRAGYDRETAEYEASRVVAYPKHSEHNMGLAVDIVSAGYRHLDENQALTAEMQWLINNCAEYGFILRYPKGKEDITGVVYEPWHFRYVGETAAREIMQRGICLEEYLGRYGSS